MLCLKCKKEISDNLLRCNYCHTKVQTVCPICGNINPLTAEYCAGCGLQLLKHCEKCNAINLPNADNCRKCGCIFEKDEAEISIADLPQMEQAPAVEQAPSQKVYSGVSKDLLDMAKDIEILEETTVESIETFHKKTPPQKIKELPQEPDKAKAADTLSPEEKPESEEKHAPDDKPETADTKQQESATAADIITDSHSVGQIKEYDQIKCKNRIVKAVRQPGKLIIGLSAPEGYGKSTVLRYLFGDLMHGNYAWLWGECSANSQISPFGIFQEMILTFFNMPNFSNMSNDFLKQAKKMLSESLPFFSQEEVFDLFNFLYPSLTANFEDILVNKDRTFALLEKLITELAKKAKVTIVIDDFDMIDGASYAFLTYFVERGNLNENLKLIISYKDNRITQGYFYSDKLNQTQYEDIRLAKLTKHDADNLIKIFLNGFNPLPDDVFDVVYKNSKGNSAYIEQMVVFLNENKAFYSEGSITKYSPIPLISNLPKNLYEILVYRLNHLQKNFPLAFKTLCTAAIMGNKFNVKLLELIMKMEGEEFNNIIKMLTTFAYVARFNSNIYEFKNTLLWRFVYEKAKQSKDFGLLNEKIFDIINSFNLSSNALKALIAQSLNQKLLALQIWTDNIKLCAYLGDEHLWSLSQKQCLKIAQEEKPENNAIIINNIQERMGKLIYLTKPSEAIPLLSASINNALKVDNKPKVIELSGYLFKSCALTGNYYGVIEAVDMVLKYIESPDKKLERALVKYKKLHAMFCIGNAEEIYNIASNEIIPIVEKALAQEIPTNGISLDVIYETWLECNLTVAMALISQGSNKSFAVLNLIDDIIIKNNVQNKNYLQRVRLARALAYSMQGDLKKSEDILITFTQQTSKEVVEPDIISMWNFINILNKLYRQDWANIKADLYSVVTFANNYNDVLVKNLLKVFLGKVLQEEGNMSKALNIFNEQVTVFAKEKIAAGAFLCWYYIAKLTLVTDGSEKSLNIAQKALEVAKNPKISNYYFMVLLKKLIAEIFIIKGDMEAAKMYIEKALMIVKKYNMKLQKVLVYQLYAKYLEEMVSKRPQNRDTYAQNAAAAYKKALQQASVLEIEPVMADLQKNYASFKAYCQLNNIKL